MTDEMTINKLVNIYCSLRDRQYAVYAGYAKLHNLTCNELFVLDILWFTPLGCTQKDICMRLSSNKQTVAAIIKKFLKKGYVLFEEASNDRRNKLILLTESGKKYAENIIPSAASAENKAMMLLDSTNASQLVKLTQTFTENMEMQFSLLNHKSI